MKTILVVYHSQEKGNTHAMAELVAAGCRSIDGVEVSMINVNEERVSMEVAEKADAYALGSPDYFSYVAGNMKQFFDDLLLASWGGKSTTEKPYVGFVTHGGGGVAVESLDRLARGTKLTQVTASITCEGAPQADDDVWASRRLGRTLAEHITALQ